jgi:formate dehydrogenase subunit beta
MGPAEWKGDSMRGPERHGASLEAKHGANGAIRDFLRKALETSAVDAVLVPVSTPAGDSYAWILTRNRDLLDNADPIAPTMPVQGAKALRSLTRKGEGTIKAIAVMRPCEIRAAIELTKLNQIRLDNITLLSYDCLGAIPLKDHVRDPRSSERRFSAMLKAGKTDDEAVKPVCRICVDFALVGSDIHFCTLGVPAGSAVLVPNSDKGSALLETLGLPCEEDISGWMGAVTELKAQREDLRRKSLAETGAGLQGLDGLSATFADCVGCHNCQSVCPICYCRQCYFDSEVARPDPAKAIDIARRRGGMAFPANRVMFHTGRMAHMSLSCVSCGQCSDACPVTIPVADIFSYMAGLTQSTFDYVAGREVGEPLPLRHFREDEIEGVHEIVKSAEQEEVAHE